MKKLTLFLTVAATMIACSKSSSKPDMPETPRTEVPQELRGNWMYGDFSLTDYWSQDPSEYLGNGLELAFAFTFNADGTYTQYFTSSAVTAGGVTYQQSVSKGTVEVNSTSQTIITHVSEAHYKRTTNGQVVEERDLDKDELSGPTSYTYTRGTEPNGAEALYLTLQGTTQPLTFLKLE
jgi:hypothetical protein